MRVAVLLIVIAVQSQAAKLPSLIRINGEPWAIKLVDKIDGDWAISGSTECKQRTIYLSKSLDSYQRAEDLLHEVQHAFTCENGEVHNDKLNNDGIDPKWDGHKGIYFATPLWHRFIRENPEVVRYIIDSDPPPPEVILGHCPNSCLH